MIRKRSIALVSSSALAAGMAQGAVTYSGLLNQQLPCPADWLVSAAEIDMDGDFYTDFKVGFDGLISSNWRKPFVDCRNNPYALPRVQADSGAPVTEFGAMINDSYLFPSSTSKAYLSQNGDGQLVGDWPQTVLTEGYVGVQLQDAGNTTTNFGWIHLMYNAAANPPYLTLVDWAYETTPGLGIPTGSTNTLGAPEIYTAPQSQNVPAGATVELKVLALGQPQPVYQWRAGVIGSGAHTNLVNGGNISGVTTATLKIDGVSLANMADYVVVLTNTLGAVTSQPPAVLTILSPPVVPSAQTLFAGLDAGFRIHVSSGFNASYKWRKNSSNLADNPRITGSTTPQLQISGITPADNGNYDVVLTMGSTTLTSAVSVLNTLPFDGQSAYELALIDARPIAYYRLNETGNPASGNLTADDNAGGFNGIYGAEVINASGAIPGPSAADGFPGFRVNNAAAMFTPDLPGAKIDVAPWNLNTDTLTMLAWIKPGDDQRHSAGIIFMVSTNKDIAGLHYYLQRNPDAGFFSVGYNWKDEDEFFWEPLIFPPANQWSMIALVIEPSAASIHLFNPGGTNSATYTRQNPRAPIPFNVPAQIGTDITSTSGGQNFNGAIDEVAIFKKALTPEELQALYDAALGSFPPISLKAARSGNNVELTWPVGRLLEAGSVSGPWVTNATATSPYTVAPAQPQRFYRVLVK